MAVRKKPLLDFEKYPMDGCNDCNIVLIYTLITRTNNLQL